MIRTLKGGSLSIVEKDKKGNYIGLKVIEAGETFDDSLVSANTIKRLVDAHQIDEIKPVKKEAVGA